MYCIFFMLNCYYNTNVTGSLAIGLGGGANNSTCYVENTNFSNISSVYRNYNTTDGGTVSIQFSGCLNGAANVGTVAAPNYTYTVIPVNDVATYIPNIACGAGATLNVSAAGVLSTNCPNVMGLNELDPTSKIVHYPTFIENEMKIDFPPTISGQVKISIVSLSGQIVFSNKLEVSSLQETALNLTDLMSGMYLVRLQFNQYISNWKIIKK